MLKQRNIEMNVNKLLPLTMCIKILKLTFPAGMRGLCIHVLLMPWLVGGDIVAVAAVLAFPAVLSVGG